MLLHSIKISQFQSWFKKRQIILTARTWRPVLAQTSRKIKSDLYIPDPYNHMRYTIMAYYRKRNPIFLQKNQILNPWNEILWNIHTGKYWAIIFSKNRSKIVLFPTCQVRVVRFYVRCAAPRTSSPPASFLFPPSAFLAGPHLPALDCSGPGRTSSASAWSQWSSPDPNC